jgi:hypothetical protein
MNKAILPLFLFTCGIRPALAQDPPKAESLLDRYVEVTGGKAAYDKIHNEVAKGTMELTGKNVKGVIVSYQAEPNKDYSSVVIEGVGKVESGTDGTVAWENSALAGPRIKTDVERDEMIRASVFNGHLNWRTLYDKVETAGSETVEGDDCYKIVLTPKTGRPETEYYSKKTGLLVKTSSVETSQMGDVPTEALVKDYKEVSGVKMAFTRVNRVAGQEIQVHLDSIEVNADIPKDRFDLPEEIKALLRKNGAVHDAK